MFNKIIAEVKAFFAPIESSLETQIREQKEIKDLADFLLANEGKFIEETKSKLPIEAYMVAIGLACVIGSWVYVSRPTTPEPYVECTTTIPDGDCR